MTPIRRSPSLLLIALLLPFAAQAAPSSIRITDGWRYQWGDGARDPRGVPLRAAESGEGENWRPVKGFETPPGRNGEDLLWLSLPVPQAAFAGPALLLEGVSNVFEVYVDGERVHSTGVIDPDGVEAYAHAGWHLVPLPQSAVGRRVLLRIQSHSANIGVRGEALAGSHAALLTAKQREELGAFLLSALLLLIAFGSFVAFALRRSRRELVHLGLFAGGMGLLLGVQTGFPEVLWRIGRPAYLLQMIGMYFAAPGLSGFFGATVITRHQRLFRRWVWLQYALAGAFTLALLFANSTFPWMFPLIRNIAVLSVLAVAVLTVLEARAGSVEARILIGGMLALVVSAFARAAMSAGWLSAEWSVLHWGVLALVASLLGVVGYRTQQVMRALELQKQKLNERQTVVERLAEGIGQGANALVSVVDQLRAATTQQNQGVNQQASALQQAHTTVEEIRQTSALTAEKAFELASSASEADEIGQQSMAALERTTSGLESIRQEVGEMARRILALEARTREIVGVVETVKGLADQSNMLALNAAIEAVRSGEHGKGFGVVAREVRSLADQSVEATVRIREILASVGNSMKEAAEASERGEDRVASAIEEVRGSSEQLRKLAELVGETGQSVRQITVAVSQQDAGTRQIATAITDLSTTMKRTLEALNQTESATGAVQQLAEGMARLAEEAR